MKMIDKMSYALWVYSNAASTTVGFYKLTGADYKDALPQVVAFNKAMKGKIEVQEPMEWGQVRAHTWSEIRANGFDNDEDMFAHCRPDGVNMSDDDVFDYWNYVAGTNNVEENSAQNKLDLLAHLGELSATPAAKFSDAVFELAEFVATHPREEVVLGNEVVDVLKAMPAMVRALSAETSSQHPIGRFSMGNGPDIEGLLFARHMAPEEAAKCACKERRYTEYVVTAEGDVWRLNVDEAEQHCVGTKLDAAGTYYSMSVAVSLLQTLSRQERFLAPEVITKVRLALLSSATATVA